jgi:hypothetical protein
MQQSKLSLDVDVKVVFYIQYTSIRQPQVGREAQKGATGADAEKFKKIKKPAAHSLMFRDKINMLFAIRFLGNSNAGCLKN